MEIQHANGLGAADRESSGVEGERESSHRARNLLVRVGSFGQDLAFGNRGSIDGAEFFARSRVE